MLSNNEANKLKAKICYLCVGESFLSAEIQLKGKRFKCSYCNNVAKCYCIEDLADRIKLAFNQHYTRTAQEPFDWQYAMLADKEFNYEWERDGEPVVYAIMDAANISEAASNDIQQILENEYFDFDSAIIGKEVEFDSNSYYAKKEISDDSWQKEWAQFERSLKTEARFFSHTAAKYLTSIFEGINEMSARDNRPLLRAAGPGTDLIALFRARVFQSEKRLEDALLRPDQELGSPPSNSATAGRMNAHGISVFYGANDSKAALAEVRPPVGSKVAIASFEIIRSIRLLDLTALSCIEIKGSIFEPAFAKNLERIIFLKNLSQHITRTVMPDDQPLEYLSTQVIADFLATEANPEIDGIIFPSVQSSTGALNIVLFHKAARVKKIDLPIETKCHVIFGYENEEGWTSEYTVFEEISAKKKNALNRNDTEEKTTSILDNYECELLDLNSHQTTLRINVDSLEVHIVNSVEFKTEVHKVIRHRNVKNNKIYF